MSPFFNNLYEIILNYKIVIIIILGEIIIIRNYFRYPSLWIIKKEEERHNANDIINHLLYSNTKNNK